MIRITIAVPAHLIAAANHLGRVLGQSEADGQTYGEPGYQDAEGHRYAVASGLVSEAFTTTAQSPLVEPPWGADMTAAALAQAAIHIGDPDQPETCAAEPDRITAIVHDDPHHALALMGLTRGPD